MIRSIQNLYSVDKFISKSISGTSGTGSFSNVSNDYITDEKLKMYGIKVIYLASDEYGEKLYIDHLDKRYSYDHLGERYSYDVTTEDINNLIRQHINKYCIREVRKEKINRINGT